jgi:hypothetical protein
MKRYVLLAKEFSEEFFVLNEYLKEAQLIAIKLDL